MPIVPPPPLSPSFGHPELGEPIQVFRPGWAPVVLCSLFGAVILAIAIPQWLMMDPGNRWILILVSLAALGILTLVGAWSRRRVLVAYAGGLALVRGGRLWVVRWQDVTELHCTFSTYVSLETLTQARFEVEGNDAFKVETRWSPSRIYRKCMGQVLAAHEAGQLRQLILVHPRAVPRPSAPVAEAPGDVRRRGLWKVLGGAGGTLALVMVLYGLRQAFPDTNLRLPILLGLPVVVLVAGLVECVTGISFTQLSRTYSDLPWFTKSLVGLLLCACTLGIVILVMWTLVAMA